MPVKMIPTSGEWNGWKDSGRMYQLTRTIRNEGKPRKPHPGRKPTPIVHGTRAGYTKRANPCRCDLCRAANAEYLRNREANIKYIPPRVHGTENGYRHFKCRCEKCTAAASAVWMKRYICRRAKCRRSFEPDARKKYCSDECRIAANVEVRRKTWRDSKRKKLTSVSV